MSTFIRFLTPDGLRPAGYSADSLADAARHEPHDGVYAVTNTYNTTQVLKIDDHLDRLEDSAEREKIALTLDRDRLRAALRSMIAEASFGNVRLRITVPQTNPDHLILTLEPFTPPSQDMIENGIRCITVPGSTRHNPAAKTADWMHDRAALQAGFPPGISDGLLLDANGAILEGFTSNFYAILAGELRTAGEGVLPGIAQQVVFEIAPAVVPVRKDAVMVADIPHCTDAFITSSSRGIIPVVEIDGTPVADGKRGTLTAKLRAAYDAWVQEHLEEL